MKRSLDGKKANPAKRYCWTYARRYCCMILCTGTTYIHFRTLQYLHTTIEKFTPPLPYRRYAKTTAISQRKMPKLSVSGAVCVSADKAGGHGREGGESVTMYLCQWYMFTLCPLLSTTCPTPTLILFFLQA